MIFRHPDHPLYDQTLPQAAAAARKDGRRWFVHHSAPGRLLPSGEGSERDLCIHGEHLNIACDVCSIEIQCIPDPGRHP